MTSPAATKAPFELATERLLLRKPTMADAELIFERYASHADATRYMSWPTHRTVDDTRAFLAWSELDWAQWPAGTFLVFARDRQGCLLGSTGLAFHNREEAATGYIFARDAWGKGYATETLHAMVELARVLGVRRLEAICYIGHWPSAHVMEKCGFLREGMAREHTPFPNLTPGRRFDVLRYARYFPPQNETPAGSVTRKTD